ncbi:MAG: hypothetical protein R3B90_22605 [Planctomycetaceae bacterium]
MDQAVFFAALSRVWQFVVAPVTMILIARHFSKVTQGYYYTFANLMALQALLELGLHGIIVSIASHEWARLRLNEARGIVGEPVALERLSALDASMRRWYGALAALFTTGAIVGGHWFFSQESAGDGDPHPPVDWQAPWIVLSVVNGGLLWMLPRTTLLEGCNQVINVNRVRMVQVVIGQLVAWGCMASGAGLWTTVAAALVRLVGDVGMVYGWYGPFFRSLVRSTVEQTLRWKQEVWPLQWRFGLRALVAAASTGIIVPVVFHYSGEVEAGRLGMTWSALVALDGVAYSWLQTRIPRLGGLIAAREHGELDRIFFRLAGFAMGVYLLGAVVLCGTVLLLPRLPFELAHKLSDRVLPFGPTFLFCCAGLLLVYMRSLGAYVLAHKRDPHIALALLPGIVAALAMFFAGRSYGSMGVSAGYLAAVLVLGVPISTWIWSTSRREWHAPLAAENQVQ